MQETPRSFVNAMDGAALAAERGFRRDLALAWHTAAFTSAASVGKLKKLDTYMSAQPQAQSPVEMLGMLRSFQDMGVPMSIRQVN